MDTIERNTNEIWKVIPGYSRYEASSFGNLRSLNYKNSHKTKILKPAFDSCGYLKTMLLSDEGKYNSWTVHRFVCLAFLGLKPNKEIEINHKDCNKSNNNIDNLEYITKSENLIHAYKNNCIIPKRGELNGMARLTEKQVKEIRDHAANHVGRYYGRKELALKYGVSVAHIKDIVTRRRDIWPHV